MAPPTGVWGIDLGQCALKAMRLEMIDDQLTATAFDYVEHPKILSQPDADPEQLTREALEKFLSRNTLKGDLVAISVPGQSGLARFVKLPPVEEKKIGDIVKFEAKQQIPFNLDEVVWDYQKIGAGIVEGGFALDTEIGLFAIKRDMVNRYLQHFKDVSVEVHLVQMAPLALCNFVTFDLLQKPAEPNPDETEAHGKKNCIVALDIGTDASNLVITDGDRIIWQRPIPLGGNNFTRALTKDLKLTFAKAEHLKRNATKSVDKNIDLKKILGSLKPVLNDFVGEVQRSLGYFTNTHRDAQIEYMVGLGNAFRLPGLQKFLSEKLSLEVRKLLRLEQLSGDILGQPAFTDNVLSFAVAYGLALQGLKLSRLHTNLLPHEIRVERMIRAKKPWAVAGAGALLLATAGCALSYAREYMAYTSRDVKEAITASGQVVTNVKSATKTFDDQKKKAENEEKAVKSVIAGQEESLNWLALNQFLSDCLPRPNPAAWDDQRLPNEANLSQAAWTKYADPSNGNNANVGIAFARFRDWRNLALTSTVNPLTTGDDTWMQDLILVNIEAVDCRYTAELKGFWTNLTALEKFNKDVVFTIRPRVQTGQELLPPEGAGWVVELRGYTYHRDKKNFIVDTLVENIAEIGRGRRSPTGKGPYLIPQPAAGAATTDAAKPAVPDHPVFGKVSHVLVLKPPFEASSSGQGSSLDSLVAAPAAPSEGFGGGGGQVQPGGVTGGTQGSSSSSKTAWKPLTGGGGSGNSGGFSGSKGYSPPAPGQGGKGGGGEGAPMGGVPGGGVPGGGAGGAGGEAAKPIGAPRTDFVVLFVWREPTPSDAFLTPVEASSSGQGGGSQGGVPGGGVPGGAPGGGFPKPGGATP